MAPVAVLLSTVFASILEVFLICMAGYALARRGILDKKTQKQINRLNVSLFTPSLLFSKVAFFLSPAKLRELWVIPIFFVIITTTSMVVAYVFGLIFRLKRSQRSFSIAASMFMNSNSLPIALMQSLVVTVQGLQWNDDDDVDSMLGRALTYLVLYSTLGMILRWSYGVHLLSQADPAEESNPPPEIDIEGSLESSPLLHASDTVPSPRPRSPVDNEPPRTIRPVSVSISLADTEGRDSSVEDLLVRRHTTPIPPQWKQNVYHRQRQDAEAKPSAAQRRHSDSRVFYSFPNTPTQSTRHLPPIPSVTSEETLGYSGSSETPDEEADEEVFVPRRHITPPSSSRLQARWRRTRHRLKKFFRGVNEFMTVPLWASLAALTVALIQPLQHLMEEHLDPLKGALSAAGNCSIPLTLVVLGAYFHAPSESKPNPDGDCANGDVSRRSSWYGSISSVFKMSTWSRHSSAASAYKSKADKQKTRGETMTVAIAVISRMFITPALIIPLMALWTKFDVVKVLDDPVFVVSTVLLISSPPALTLAQITQAASGDAFERLISRTIFWAYCVVTPPATIIYVVIGMLLSNLEHTPH